MTMSPQDQFWDLAEIYLAEDDIEEGTLMNNPCLRASGDFLATIQRKTGHLIVKLTAERVGELIENGTGLAFAPAGKTFAEWLAVPSRDVDLWKTVIDEALQINRTRQ
jgi:hypothetical protein